MAYKRLGRPVPPLRETAPAQGVPARLGMLSVVADAPDLPPGAGGYATYRKMQADPQVKACLATKKFAVLSRGWEVHPASASDTDRAVAGFVRGALRGLQGGGLLDALYDALDALALGVSLLEINYRLEDGRVLLKSLKAKDPADFTWETDAYYNLKALRPAFGPAGRALPRAKFLVYAYMPRYAHPLGQSDLRAAYKPWYVKEQLGRWWAKYLEKFGLPTVTGTYDASKGYGPRQQRELLGIVRQVHNESAVVLPSDITLGLLEAQRAGAPGFEAAVSYLDRAIAKSILGQTLTVDSTSGTSTNALGQVHRDVLGFYLAKLQRDLEETVLGAQLLPRLVAYNFPPGTPCPTVRLGGLDPARLAQAGALISDLVAGQIVAPDEPWIRTYLDLPPATLPGG